MCRDTDAAFAPPTHTSKRTASTQRSAYPDCSENVQPSYEGAPRRGRGRSLSPPPPAARAPLPPPRRRGRRDGRPTVDRPAASAFSPPRRAVPRRVAVLSATRRHRHGVAAVCVPPARSPARRRRRSPSQKGLLNVAARAGGLAAMDKRCRCRGGDGGSRGAAGDAAVPTSGALEGRPVLASHADGAPRAGRRSMWGKFKLEGATVAIARRPQRSRRHKADAHAPSQESRTPNSHTPSGRRGRRGGLPQIPLPRVGGARRSGATHQCPPRPRLPPRRGCPPRVTGTRGPRRRCRRRHIRAAPRQPL